jgi:2-succinyl-6-hydroxy-2,4-cyclohexadiene-1-carboxylate synthase
MWLLLHGFTGAPGGWSGVADSASQDRPPLTPALTGHGADWQSRAVDSFEGEVMRLASMVSGGARPRLLCGYSMGARVALGLLVSRPDLFDAALLIGMHPGLPDEAARAQRRDLDAGRVRQLRQDGLPAFVSAWEKLPLFATQRDLPDEALEVQRATRLGHDSEGLARSLEVLGLAEMPDYGPAIASIDVPVTLMTGSLDRKFCEVASALADLNPRVDAEVVERVGHNVLLEAPTAVAATMKRAEDRARV